ncbi:hypothetical protein PR048_017387 [Dryococelus australis]|uniref:Uncharacterized protein n=1 Tax=Dryococelus australis TaxID=614101 RepID=A0ABQ9H9E3_9NEOP|nr:hypothetical protein PR048_017387 [Dryococelus australis]
MPAWFNIKKSKSCTDDPEHAFEIIETSSQSVSDDILYLIKSGSSTEFNFDKFPCHTHAVCEAGDRSITKSCWCQIHGWVYQKYSSFLIHHAKFLAQTRL